MIRPIRQVGDNRRDLGGAPFSAHSRASGNPALGPRFRGDERCWSVSRPTLISGGPARRRPRGARPGGCVVPRLYTPTPSGERPPSRLAARSGNGAPAARLRRRGFAGEM